MRPELLVVDVDGTLLGRDHRVSRRVLAALAACQTAGVPVALSTGRPMTSLAKVAAPLGLSGPHVAFDGALVGVAGERPLFCQPITLAAARALASAARAVDLCVELYFAEGHYVESHLATSRLHGELILVQPTVRSLDEVLAESREGDIVKGQLLGEGEAGRARIRSVERQVTGLRFGWAKPPPGMGDLDYVNVTHPAVSKGAALVELGRAFAVAPERMLAVGDGINDIPLIEVAGFGVAMGNAPEAVKVSADAVVPSVDEDGLAIAIERYVLRR